MPYGDKYYFAKSNGGVFRGKNKISALVKNPFNINLYSSERSMKVFFDYKSR